MEVANTKKQVRWINVPQMMIIDGKARAQSPAAERWSFSVLTVVFLLGLALRASFRLNPPHMGSDLESRPTDCASFHQNFLILPQRKLNGVNTKDSEIL